MVAANLEFMKRTYTVPSLNTQLHKKFPEKVHKIIIRLFKTSI